MAIYSFNDVLKKSGAKPSNVKLVSSAIKQPEEPTQAPTQQSESPGIFSGLKNIKDEFVGGNQQFAKGYNQTVNATKNGSFSEIGQGILNEGAGFIRSVFSPFTGITQSAAQVPGIKEGLQGVNNNIVQPLADNPVSNNPKFQKYVMEHPNIDEVTGNILTIAGTAAAGAFPEVKGIFRSPTTEIKAFHGTTPENAASIKQNGFDLSKARGGQTEPVAINLTTDAEDALHYAGNKPEGVVPVTMKGKNIKTFSTQKDFIKAVEDSNGEYTGPNAAKFLNDYDGVVIKGASPKGGDMLLTNKPGQVSVTKNVSKPITSTSIDQTVKIKGVANDWAKPVTSNNPSFSRAGKVLSKSPETPQFLAEQGLNPFRHIEDGRYITEDSVIKLRDTAGKMSFDTLRPSLQMADYSTPKTPVSDFLAPAISRVKNTLNITAGDTSTIEGLLRKEVDALNKKYPDGMSLTDMHDEKITYAKNSGYSPIKDPAVNNKATANRALSNTLGNMVETKAPTDLNVSAFNKYLSKYYKGADYLDAINGKKAPVSLGQQVARGIARFGGAKIGSIIGGDVVSSFAGYQIGKALEHALENLTNPLRDSFLSNLKMTNPEAFAKVQEFLGKAETDRATRLALPSGDINGVPKVINAGPGPDKSGVKLVPAKKLLPTANPKTGRMQKTYSSEPQ